jgi:transcriptional regulator with XRE-family HTH domain
MIYQKLGEKIRKLRKGQELSQEDLADLIKLDVRTVVSIEAGKRNPTLRTIHKIARALKTPVHELLKF